MTPVHNNEDLQGECAIFISSCDAYSDAWEPFFELFFRYWSDCPFPVYIISNGKVYPDSRVTTIDIDPDQGWASNMLHVLAMHPYPYMLYLQEDYFIKRRIDTERILDLLALLKREQAACLQLYPAPGPDMPYKRYRKVGMISQDKPWRVSLQARLWNTVVFRQLLAKGERGVDMEHKGSIRSAQLKEPFLSVKRGIFFPYDKSAALDYFSTGIIKHRWHAAIPGFFKKQGIVTDLSQREIEPLSEGFRHAVKSFPLIAPLFRLIFKIEYKVRSVIKEDLP